MATNKVGPIKPSEVAKLKANIFPDAVFEAFNELLARGSVGNRSITIKTKDVVALMEEKGLKRDDIFNKGWLDVEDVYRKAGWKVEYDKPGYNETYEATFKFSPRE
jgi:hypothetical protein